VPVDLACEQRPWKSLAHSNASTPSLHISGLLHAAALNADVDLVEECLREGADPAFADSNGLTALHFAGFVGGEAGKETTRLLLAAGASPDAIAATFGTPLHVAARFGAISCMALLLHGKANPNARDFAGRTPLHTATAAWEVALSYEEHFRYEIEREASLEAARQLNVPSEASETFLTDDKWVVSACDEADDAALRVPDKTAPPLEEGIQKMKKKEKKRGGKKGKGKGKSKAAMAEPPSIPPDAIGLSVLLLEAGADPRIQDTTGQSQPRWVHEVWQALERPGVRSRGVDLDELRDFAWKAACAQVEELGDRKKGGKGKGKSKKK